MSIKRMIWALAGMCLTSMAMAGEPVREQYQVPQCLAAKMTTSYKMLAENQYYQIIDIPSQELNALSRLADEGACGRFINVSHHIHGVSWLEQQQSAQALLQKKSVKARLQRKITYQILHPQEVNEALKNIISDNVWQTVAHLASYYNRSATKDTGVEAANWLKAQFEAMAREYNRIDTAAYFVRTGQYKQPSLVTVIGKDLQAPGIVIGAHMDTLDGRMPGAGDDASGSASILEMTRVLLASNLTFKRPIYIIWYAAEERGLVGSQYVVNHFQHYAIPVQAVLQLDMAGYRANPGDPSMWVYTDYTHSGLSKYVAQLINTYIHVPVKYSQCGYGCSDHASWNEIGIPAAFPCETSFKEHNPYIHTSADSIDLLNLEHMVNFTKLAIAFAVELALE